MLFRSVSQSRYADYAHTVGIAADIIAYDRFGNVISPWKIAEVAEKLGFNGIGVMSTACHCDERTIENYKNGHWFGDETTGKNVTTFITKTDGSIEALQNIGRCQQDNRYIWLSLSVLFSFGRRICR